MFTNLFKTEKPAIKNKPSHPDQIVSLTFVDGTKEVNDVLRSYANTTSMGPLKKEGFMFSYEIFNKDKKRIGNGAVALIAAANKVLVDLIYIEKEFRKQGFATATIKELQKWSGGCNIVPVGIEDSSRDFWLTITKRLKSEIIVEQTIGKQDAYEMVEEYRK